MYKAGVVGAAGFAGIQAVQILNSHPEFELVLVTSDANVDSRLDEVYPALLNAECGSLKFKSNDCAELDNLDVVFLAVPHKAAMSKARRLLDAGVVVIDLSADFRLEDPKVYEKWYGVPHTELEILAKRAFGLPELFPNDLKTAAEKRAAGKEVLVACAGCYVTASTLATKPFVKSQWFDASMPPVIDAISGVTGAGKNPGERGLYVMANEDYEAYGVAHHRHTPEMVQILDGQQVVFTPHLAPANRGILSTITMKCKEVPTIEELHELYAEAYKDCPFVKVLEAGKFPKTSSITRTNFCQIGVAVNGDAGVVTIISAIDNLVKGAAGQAIQCANIVFDLPETCGLIQPTLNI